MSVFFPITGTAEEPVSLRPDGTGVEDILTVGNQEEIAVLGIIVVNEDDTNKLKASIWYTVGSTDHLIFTAELDTLETVNEILPAPIRLTGKLGTRKIKVQAEAADKVTFTVIYAGLNVQVVGK